MRLPKESELSKEQKEVINAPAEGTTLVAGPPGSGKTVVAVMRQRALTKQGRQNAFVVFNRVLMRFTANDRTFHSWLEQWWCDATTQVFPKLRITDGDRGTNWSAPDFARGAELAAGSLRSRIRQKGHWGHLILDEAQDFSPEAHRLLFQVQQRVFADMAERDRPSLCVLADENQRITDTNSTLSDIRQAHVLLTDRDVYSLSRNYRNTKSIAQFAAHFYVGLPTGIPQLPTRDGDKPRILVADLNESVERIATYARNHPNEEVGVLVQYTQTRKKVYNKLEYRLRGTPIRVQTYGSSPEAHSNESALEFDKPGVLTVLCFSSAKGLEFDTLFLPELQTIRIDGAGRDELRMSLYVMCSRARNSLWLTISDPTKTHEVWRLLPPQELWVEE